MLAVWKIFPFSAALRSHDTDLHEERSGAAQNVVPMQAPTTSVVGSG